jgi:hypothetical protein
MLTRDIGIALASFRSGWRIRLIAMRQCASETGDGHFFALISPRIVLVFLAILAVRVLSVLDGLSHAPVWLMRQDATARAFACAA